MFKVKRGLMAGKEKIRQWFNYKWNLIEKNCFIEKQRYYINKWYKDLGRGNK